MKHYMYLMLLLVSLSYPLASSFDKKVHYAQYWRFLFPALLLTGIFFLVWDYFFTQWGVWSFNPKYVMGMYLFGMPIEEWMFFIIVPYCCLFIYDVLPYYFPQDPLASKAKWITWFLILSNIILGVIYLDRNYTAFHLLGTALILVLHVVVFDYKYLGKFYMAYVVSLVPFLLVNGILTALPVVTYNNAENMDLRIGSIPLEDTMYCLQLLLMNVSIYEYLRSKYPLTTVSQLSKSIDHVRS